MATRWTVRCGHIDGGTSRRRSRSTRLAAAIVVAVSGWAGGGPLRAAPIERSPTTAHEPTSDKRPPEVLEAIKRFEGGNTEKAFELLKAASAKYPNLAPPRVMLANMYFSDRQRAAGLQQLELAVVESPEDPEPHLIFGDIAVFERRVSDAEAQYEAGRASLTRYSADAKRKSALTSQCQLGLATVAKMRGRWDAVQKQLSLLLEAQPQNASAHERLAEALIAIGKPDEALKELQTAVKADAKLPPAPMLMAEINRQAGKGAEVEKWLTRAVQEAPQDVRTRLAMAKWFLDEGQLEKAAAEFDEAEKIDPKSIEVKLGIGTVARFRHDYAKARQYFDAVLEQMPGNFSASNQLALLLADQADRSKLPQALEIATANLQSAPQNSEAESTLGWVYYKLNKLDDAERHLRASAARGIFSRDTAYFVAKLTFDRGQRDESLSLLRQAVKDRGPFAHAEEAAHWLTQRTKSSEAPQK
jgi:tetratricopeptide (TPR) repeat protein